MSRILRREVAFLPCLVLCLGPLVIGWATLTQAAPTQEPLAGMQYRTLPELLQSIVTDPALSGALVGAQVTRVQDGKTIFAYQNDLLINPASVTKVFTTAAALCLLHPDFRFKTEIYALNPPVNGQLMGPWFLRGTGDPFLVSERLQYMAAEVKALGIDQIQGALVLDDTYFDEQGDGPGWDQDHTARPYQAPMGALSLNFNSVAVLVFPTLAGKASRVDLFPGSAHFKLINQVTTSDRTHFTLDSRSVNGKDQITVSGRIAMHHPGARSHCKVVNPSFYTGYSLLDAFKRQGIKVGDTVKRGPVPAGAELIFSYQSLSLGELVRKVNKLSQNFMAEQLWKTLGAEFLGPAGSWRKGERVMQAFLEEEVGIPPGAYVLSNGSGLNDVNRVTTSQVVALLRYVWNRFDVQSEFLSSLAIAGADGTVINRFTHPMVARTIRVKTGTLENVRAMSGYAQSRGHEVFAFALLIQDFASPGAKVSHLIDRFAAALSRADGNRLVTEDFDISPLESTSKNQPLWPPALAPGTEESLIPSGEKIKSSPETP